jgi:hypothetical protein
MRELALSPPISQTDQNGSTMFDDPAPGRRKCFYRRRIFESMGEGRKCV